MAAPRKHPPQGAAEVIKQMASQGHSATGIAAHFKVVRSTIKRWFEEDESLLEAFEQGRETERQALHALIVQSAVMNKPANANAMFLLKCRHGYREFDSPNTKVDVNVTTQPVHVLKVTDFGSDEEWALKTAEQQRKLLIDAQKPIAPRLEAPGNALLSPCDASVEMGRAQSIPQTQQAPVAAPTAPSWNLEAKSRLPQDDTCLTPT
jgi:hypothetical protein